MKWSSIWSNNKILISITILETNIQKESPMHRDLFSVNQMFNMTTVTSGTFFNMNCDVGHKMARQISSVILLQAWMISALNSILVCGFFGKILFLRTFQRKESNGCKSGLCGGQLCPYVKLSGNRFEMTCESKMSCRKSKTTYVVWSLAPSCMKHCVWNGKPVARRWGTKMSLNMLK
jgi:hypothetical protein